MSSGILVMRKMDKMTKRLACFLNLFLFILIIVFENTDEPTKSYLIRFSNHKQITEDFDFIRTPLIFSCSFSVSWVVRD